MKLKETASHSPDTAAAYDSDRPSAPHTFSSHQHHTRADFSSSLGERALSALGAAVISAILVNPLDVAKTRLQAQAAGVPEASNHRLDFGRHVTLGQNKYKGTLDVFYKIIQQEGFGRLWRGTSASLALAIPTVGIYLPCYDVFRNWFEDATTEHAPSLTPYAPLVAGSIARAIACIACSPIELAKTRMQAFKELNKRHPLGIQKTLVGILSPTRSFQSMNTVHEYRILWTGVGAQLARDVPFSAICWSTLEPIRRRLLGIVGDQGGVDSLELTLWLVLLLALLLQQQHAPLMLPKLEDRLRRICLGYRTQLPGKPCLRFGGIKECEGGSLVSDPGLAVLALLWASWFPSTKW